MDRRSVLFGGSAALAGLAISGHELGSRAAAEPATSLPQGFESNFATVNGIRKHYVTAGSGPFVLLLHGWPETWYSWHAVMARLADRFTLVAPDLRGVGLTERPTAGYDKRTIAEDIAALIVHLGQPKVSLVGHDMGGKAAYVLAKTKPEFLSKLVLVDCFPPGAENMDVAKGGAWHYGFHMAADFPERLTAGRERQYIAAQIKAWSHQKDAISEPAIDEYARHYAGPGGMTAGFNYYRALRDDIPYVASIKKRKIIVPVLTVAGRYSVGDKLHASLADEAGDLRGIIAENSGHFVAEEEPEFFCAELARFLAS